MRPLTREISYAPPDAPHDDRRSLLVMLPESSNGRCLFFIHGGGWSAGCKEQWRPVMEYFCGLNYVCVSAGYRLAPNHRFPAQFEDMRLAFSKVKARADEWNFDATRMAAWGSSAGGHLAAMLATAGVDDDLGTSPEMPTRDTRPAAAVCLCPVFSLLPESGIELSQEVTELLGGTAHENLNQARSASPIERVTSETPPTLIINGDADNVTPLAHQEAMLRVLRGNHVPAELAVLAGVGHGFGYGVSSDAQRATLHRATQFLEEFLNTR